MKIEKNLKKSKPTDAKREFYSCLDEMKDLYRNQGYLKQKSLYEKMKEKYKWQMSYISFTLYFNKEIKNQNSHPTLQAENLNSKKNEIIENSSQNIDQSKKETNNETGKTSAVDMTDDAYKAAKARLERSMSYHEQGIQNHLKYRQELKEKEENGNNGNS
ncbi:MAG: hypothetical protein PHS85_01835 [Sulfurovum sp.]|nr:hypothetical protein [Sulfurovum sp.]